MPTTAIGPYRFRFYSSDVSEPPHVHVIRAGNVAKVWLQPVSLEYNRGYNSSELNRIMRLIEEYREQLLGAWHAHFDK